VENVPATSAELIARMKSGGRNLGPWAQADLEKLADQGSPVLIPLSTYERWFREKLTEAHRAAVIEQFGPPPGRLMVVNRNGQPHLVIPRLGLGNVILAPQPERGEKQDEKLLHSRDVPPPHNYLAFYWWLEEEFRADAIVHWGTHGTLELLPGKEAGLSKDCWSDLCVGHVPVVDLWITDNLGEATLARRRSYAQLVDHMVPPALDADLKDAHRPLHDEIEKFNTLEAGLLREEFRKNITRQARETGLSDAIQAAGSEPLSDLAIAKLDGHLHQLYEARTPLRLHILGEPPRAEEMTPYLVEILGTRFLERLAIADGRKVDPGKHRESDRKQATEFLAAALDRAAPPSAPLPADLAKDVEFAREVRERLRGAGAEVTGLLKALSARYVEPGPGPEPIRNPASVPTGRNLYALNPEEIPTRAAWEVARKLVDQMLRERSPRKIGMDLNGMETMRDFGVMEAQILYLLGARPIWDRNQLVIDVELIPRQELKRDRVDVFVAMGGQYKENFPTRVKLIDKAIRLASASPEETNPVRAGTASVREALLKRGFSSARAGQFAAARIFGTKPGNMTGTNILYLVPRSGVWDKDDEIASVYVDNMNHVFTGETWGEKVDGLYEEAIQGTDTVLRVWASNMTSQLSNHHAYEYLGGLSLAVKKLTGKSPAALIADVRDPSGGRIRDFEEVLAANFQAELLNRKWIEGMKSHDYAGAGHMAELVKNTFGWSVTRPESVSQKTWNDIHAVYVEDRFNLGLNEWFEKVSPHAQQEVMATLLEAARKELWKATPQQLEKLARRYAESVQKHGESGGLVGGGNARLVNFTGEALTTSTIPGGRELAANLKQAFDKASAAAAQHKVTGPKLEAQIPARTEATQPEVAPTAPSQTGNAQAQAAPAMPPAPWWRSWPAAAVAMFCALLLFGFFRRTGSA
jgi:cobaltochelatase CobN